MLKNGVKVFSGIIFTVLQSLHSVLNFYSQKLHFFIMVEQTDVH